MNTIESVKFALAGINTDQFATIKEVDDDKIGFNISVSIHGDIDNPVIGVELTVKLLSQNEPFLIVGVTCHFNIEQSSWSDLTDPISGDVILPKGFIQHIKALTLSTARGVLHSKTENTPFNKYFIPLINLVNQEDNDLVIKKG